MSDAPAVLLLVDDDEAKRYVIGTWLRRAGHTVIEVGTGREALEKAGAVELVLLDVNLPDLSGYEVCRLIKGDPATAATPVIQVSATAVEVSDRAMGLTQGADAYLTEPTEPEELLAVVVAALRYYRARQRAERTASLLASLTRATLDINAAGTFDRLARAAAQRSLLPMVLPEVPDLAMSFRYIPASDQAEVGGDFYEALSWRDRVLVAIGDVQGHSLLAATVMGELRHALRAFVVEGHSPLAITGLVNEVLTRYHPGIIATLCLALLDPASGDLQIVNCGHMPALLVDGQDAVYVGEGGLLLGLPMHEPHVETTSLPPGGTLLLMTDGLVEERDVFLDVNLEKLRVAAQEVSSADVEAFSNHLMAIFGPREDDVAMIALRRTPRITT